MVVFITKKAGVAVHTNNNIHLGIKKPCVKLHNAQYKKKNMI